MCVRFRTISVGGTVLGTLHGVDPDGDPLRFDLTSDGGGPFSMSSTGTLYVDTSKGWLDFEGVRQYVLTVSLSESSNALGTSLLSASQGSASLAVSVLDVNERPVFSSMASASGWHIAEESTYPSVVSVTGGVYIRLSDNDTGNGSTLLVSTTSASSGFGSGYFELVGVSSGTTCRGSEDCVLRVSSASPRLDYDAGLRVVNVSIVITDATGLSSTSSVFAVSVDDINQST